MPRAKSDSYVTHRIELGVKEREMVESALMGYNFNRVATPVVAGMSDVSFMLVVAGLMSAIFPEIIIPKGIEQADEIIDAIVQGIQQNRERNPDDTFDISDRGFWQYLFEEGTIAGRIFT